MKQFAVIGLGRFGRSVANTLNTLGYQVLAIDISSEKIKKVAPNITRSVECDATNDISLRASGIMTCEIAVVAVGSLSTTTRIIMALKELKIEHIITRADDFKDKNIMQLLGADQVVLPEHDMGKRLALSFVFPQVKEFLELTPETGIFQLMPSEKMIGSCLGEIKLKERFGVQITAIISGEDINYQPCKSDIVGENDTILVIGKIARLHKLLEKYNV